MTTLTPTAHTTTRTYPDDTGPSLVVTVTWTGVPLDRPDGYAWSLGTDTPARRRLAARLIAAIHAGVVFSEPAVGTDVNDHTYVVAWNKLNSRHMSASLRRLGF